ncbi:MAG: hypothetical protein AAGD38_18495 [Acidobacteriota bacterium]
MHRTALATFACILALGVLALIGAQWKLEIGDFAENPQVLRIPHETVRIAGGGRALIEFIGPASPESSPDPLDSSSSSTSSSTDLDAPAHFAVRCNEEQATFELALGTTHPDAVCGVTITPLEYAWIEEKWVLIVEVAW